MASPPGRTPRILRSSWAGVLVALVACAAYANSLGGDFVWDDRILILDGDLAQAWTRLGDVLSRDFFARSEFELVYGYYRPLTTASYLLDYAVHGLQPWGYHLTNVLLHAAAGALVFLVSVRLGWTASAAAITALLFAVHPVHTENVAWISGRTDVIAFIFAMLALLAELASGSGIATRLGRRIVAPALFLMALLAKETALVMPLWLAAIELVKHRRTWGQVAVRLLPYVAVCLTYLVWRLVIIEVGGPARPPIHTATAVALNLLPTMARYVSWLLLPWQQSAFIINPYVTSAGDPRLAIAILSLGSAATAIWLWQRGGDRDRIRCMTLLFLVTMLPNLNLVRPASPLIMGATMAERFCYFPSFPFLALVALGLEAIASRFQFPGASAVKGFLLAGLIFTFGFMTAERNRVWRDEPTFLRATLATAPNAVLLWGRLAEYQLETKDLAGAAESIRHASAIQPDDEQVQSARAYLALLEGRREDALQIQEKLTRRARRGAAPARNNLAYLYLLNGRHAEARAILEDLVRRGRAYGDVYANLAEAHRAAGDRGRARHYYRQALDARPDDLQVAAALVALEVEDGHPEAAEAVYQAIRAYYPAEPRLDNNIAMIRAGAGHLDSAIALLGEVTRDYPDYAGARVNLAQVLYRRGDRGGAIEQLRAARRLPLGGELEAIVDRQLAEWTAP